MAAGTVIGKAEITISKNKDISAYYRYYLSVMSTLGAPTVANTTVRPPTSVINGNTYTWNDSQPAYDTTGTYTLYFVDCTVFSDGTLQYSSVSVDSDYEAAKIAYNESVAATNAANAVNSKLAYYSRYCTAMNTATAPDVDHRWRKFASYTETGVNQDPYIIFDVITTGDYQNQKKFGQLKAHFRTSSTKGTLPSSPLPSLEWVTRGEGIVLSHFAIAYKATSGTSVQVELWVRTTVAYSGYVFFMQREGKRTSISESALWTLYDSKTASGETSITSGFTTVYSVDIDNARKVAENYMSFEAEHGLMIADLTSGVKTPSQVTAQDTFNNVLIDSDSVDIRQGLTVLASFGQITTIGRDDIAQNSYLELSSSGLGIYRESSDPNANRIQDFGIHTYDNQAVTLHKTGVYRNATTPIKIIDCYLIMGFEALRIVVTHPNGTSTAELEIDLTDVSELGDFEDISFSTGCKLAATFVNNNLYSYIRLKIKKETDSSITRNSVFTIDCYYSGGKYTNLYVSGSSRYKSKFAIETDGNVYSSGNLVNVAYPYGYNFVYPYDNLSDYVNNDYWVTSGYLTGSSKSIWFSITLPRALPNSGRSINFVLDTLELAIRVQNTVGSGAYIGADETSPDENGEDYTIASNVTINVYPQTENVLTFWIQRSSAYRISTGNLPNNVSLGIRIIAMDIIFDKS